MKQSNNEQPPKWLDEIALSYWHQHIDHITLTPQTKETFAIMCDCYSKYRQAQRESQQKAMLEMIYKLGLRFGIVPFRMHKPDTIEVRDEFNL